MPTDEPSAPSTAAIALATAILSLATGYFLGSASSLNLFTNTQDNPTSTHGRKKKEKPSWPNSYDVEIHPDSSDEELMARLGRRKGDDDDDDGEKARGKGREVKDSEDEDAEDESGEEDGGEEGTQEGLSTFEGNKEECKLVLVVRNDLGMGKGMLPFPPLLPLHHTTPLTYLLIGKISAQCSHATLANYTTLLSSAPNTTHPLLKRWASLGQAKVVVQCSSEEELLELQAKALSLGLCARVVHDAGRTQVQSGTATVLGVGPGPRGVVDLVTGGLKLL